MRQKKKNTYNLKRRRSKVGQHPRGPLLLSLSFLQRNPRNIQYIQYLYTLYIYISVTFQRGDKNKSSPIYLYIHTVTMCAKSLYENEAKDTILRQKLRDIIDDAESSKKKKEKKRSSLSLR